IEAGFEIVNGADHIPRYIGALLYGGVAVAVLDGSLQIALNGALVLALDRAAIVEVTVFGLYFALKGRTRDGRAFKWARDATLLAVDLRQELTCLLHGRTRLRTAQLCQLIDEIEQARLHIAEGIRLDFGRLARARLERARTRAEPCGQPFEAAQFLGRALVFHLSP